MGCIRTVAPVFYSPMTQPQGHPSQQFRPLPMPPPMPVAVRAKSPVGLIVIAAILMPLGVLALLGGKGIGDWVLATNLILVGGMALTGALVVGAFRSR